MRLFDRLKKTNQPVDLPKSEIITKGLERRVTTTSVTNRTRMPHEQAKVEAMQAFIGIAANEDLDPLFAAIFTTAKELGYKLQDEPYALIHKLNNVR